MKPLFLNLPDSCLTINLNRLIAFRLKKDADLHKDVYHMRLSELDWIKLSPEDSILLGRAIVEFEVFPKEGGVVPGII